MKMRGWGRDWRSTLLTPEAPLYVAAVLVALAIIGLALVVVWSTFVDGLPGMGGRYSLVNYADVLFYPVALEGAINTLIVGLGTVAVSLFFGLPIAWFIHRTATPLKSLALTLMFMHAVVPTFLKTMGWIVLLSPKIGIVNQFLRTFVPVESGPLSIYNLPSIAFVQGLTLTPTMFFMISGAFLAVDSAFEEAAEVCGASKLHALRRITVPLISPAVLAGIIYTFMTAVSMFEVASLLGRGEKIHVFATLMYTALNPETGLPRFGIAGVYGVLLFMPTLGALYFYQRMLRLSYRYETVTGKGYRPKLIDLGRWKWAAAGFILFFFTLDPFLPLLSTVWISFVPFIQPPSPAAISTMSLNGYGGAINVLLEGGVLANTLTLIVSVGLGIGLISLIISWVVVKTRFRGRFVLDTISMLPHAIPRVATAFAVAFIALAFLGPIGLYGSVAAIVLAHTMSWIGFGTRTLNSTLIQIHSDLEDAVLVSGGSRLVAIRGVFIPLLASPITYVVIWTMLLSYREVTMALFLQTPRNTVIATSIWLRWLAMDTAAAGALGTIMVITMGTLVFALLRLRPQIFLGRARE